MKLSQFKFKLPEERIALHPTKYRDESRLMVLHRKTGEIEHRMFKDILDYFDDKDVFVFNDTKVFPARLYGNSNFWTGVLAAALADGLLWGAATWLVEKEPELVKVVTPQIMLLVSVAVLLFGVLITWLCALFSVNKYLRMKAGALYRI